MNKPVNINTSLYFNKKDFYSHGWNKHMIGGAAFGASGALAVVGLSSLAIADISITPESLAMVALSTGTIAGAAVELMDYLNNRINHGHHGVELMDFIFTSLGGALAATAIYLIASLII